MKRTDLQVKNRPVVGAAIVDDLEHPRTILAAARAYPSNIAGRFELPGGKIEPHESAVDALVREVKEELGTTVTVGDRVNGPLDGWWPILGERRMAVWFARVADGAPAPQAGSSHQEIRWVTLEEAAALPWLDPDFPIVEEIVRVCGADKPASK